MADYIDRQAAINATHNAIFDFFDIYADDEESPITYKDEQLLKINKAITSQLKALPSEDIQPVRHGHWIYIRTEEDGNGLYECSACGKGEIHVPIVEVKYCWNCGARMDEGRE